MHEIYYSGLVQLSQDIFSNIETFIQAGATPVENFMDGPQWGNLSYSKKNRRKIVAVSPHLFFTWIDV